MGTDVEATGRSIRWTDHARQNLRDREIPPTEADKTLTDPELVVHGQVPRTVFMRRYHDSILGKEMLLRVVVEDTLTERVVVTVYKTSQVRKYMPGGAP